MNPLNVLRLFGTPDVRTASDAKAHSVLAQTKHVAFLAIAATARRSLVRRDRAMALLWPDLDDDRARNALSKAIHHSRRALGEDALVGRFAEEIGLDETRWSVDVWDFEDAIARGANDHARALYRRGVFMDGVHIPDASALEHWIDGERDGDLASAAAHMRAVGELSPFDEQTLRRRRVLLDRNADHAGAIRAGARTGSSTGARRVAASSCSASVGSGGSWRTNSRARRSARSRTSPAFATCHSATPSDQLIAPSGIGCSNDA
jgi:hypothetical protein